MLLLLGGLFATTSALNATLYSSSRVSFAMGRDFNLPGIFSRVHRARRTPHGAILSSAAVIVTMAVALPIEDVASATDITFMCLFAMVNLSLVALRYQRPDTRRGFSQVPLGAVAAAGLHSGAALPGGLSLPVQQDCLVCDGGLDCAGARGLPRVCQQAGEGGDRGACAPRGAHGGAGQGCHPRSRCQSEDGGASDTSRLRHRPGT